MTRVVVIGGGQSAEHDVSLAGAAGVAAALRENGFAVDELTIERDGCWAGAEGLLGDSSARSLQGALAVLARTRTASCSWFQARWWGLTLRTRRSAPTGLRCRKSSASLTSVSKSMIR
jgi:hypothetical protein